MSNNRTLGALALLMALLLLVFGWGLTAPFAYEPVGPRAFPLMTALLIGGCGVALLVTGGGKEAALPRGLIGQLVLLSVVLLAYALTFDRVSYIPATLVMAAVVARIFGAGWPQAVLTGAALAVGSFYVFDHGLDVVLPTGILGDLL